MYLHFSGHGQQIQDDNRDEFDGLDEALVPYDAPMEYAPGYRGERHWRDDEIGAFLARLQEKLGPSGQIFTVFDACHSGTATRGWGVARGTETILAAPDAGVSDSPPSEKNQADPWVNSNALAPVVSFFAASPQELNREYLSMDGRYYGPLSYSLAKVWLARAAENWSYRTLFQEVRAEMALIVPRQHPRAEGKLDERLWGGSAGKTGEQCAVTGVWDARTVRIDAGELLGLQKNSILRFESADGRQVLAKGTVVEAGLSWAEVELDADVDREAILAARAIVEFKAPANIRCQVRLEMQGNAAFAQALRAQFERCAIAETTAPVFDLRLEADEQGLCRIWTRDEQLLYEDHLSAIGFDAEYLVEDVFLPYMQAGFIRSLAISDPALQAEIRIVPVHADGSAARLLPDAVDGLWRLPEGARFVLEVENRGADPFYFSVLDVQPDNRLNLLVPETFNRRTADDYYLEPRTGRRIDEVWEVSPPFGMETLKLVLSDKPLQLASLVKTRGQGASGRTFFERLLAYSFQPGTRGILVTPKPVGEGERISLQDLRFEIVRRKE